MSEVINNTGKNNGSVTPFDNNIDANVGNKSGVFQYQKGLFIKPDDFIMIFNTYTDDESRTNLLASVIKRTYVPILEKRIIIEEMFKKAVVKDGANYYVDQFLYRYNMRIAILIMYTTFDLQTAVDEVDDNPKQALRTIYDVFNEYGIINAIIDVLDEDEIEEVNAIAKSVKDTWFNANKTIEAIVGRLSKEFAGVIGQFMQAGAAEFVKAVADGTIPSDEAGQMIDYVSQLFGQLVARNESNEKPNLSLVD